MNYLINILKKRGIFILLAATATIIGCLFFWSRNIAKKPTEVATLLPLPPPEIEQHQLDITPQASELKEKFADFPKELPVYQIISPKIFHEQALLIAENFGFQEPPLILQDVKLGPTYNWSTTENYLTIIINQGSVSYGLDLLSNPGILKGNLPSLEETKMSAVSYLKNQMISLPQNLEPTVKQTQYLKKSGPTYKPAHSPETADVIQIEFEFKIDEFNIFSPIPNVVPLTLRIGPEMKIVSLDYQPPFNQFNSYNSYSLKTEEAVLENIEAMPQISYLQFPSYQELPTKEDYQKISLIEFKEVKLGYYQPSLPEEYLQPVFLISGVVQLENKKTGEVFLYLPAIAEEYFVSNL